MVRDENLFNPRAFSRPHEPPFPDEAKRMLSMKPIERTEEMLRYIMISLNFSVPEFSELPIRIQKMWAQRAFYQEFEPERMIVRQGHYPLYYYMVISGKALVIEASTSWTTAASNSMKLERKASIASSNDLSNVGPNDEDGLVYTPLSAIKRGDCFGDTAIINNTKRDSSIKVCSFRILINKEFSFHCH